MALRCVITGTRREASCIPASADNDELQIYRSGADADAARDMARLVADSGCAALISYGLAGALDPELSPGTVLLPERVISEEGGEWRANADARGAVGTRLTGAGISFNDGDIFGADGPVTGVNEKASLYFETGAVAVDMESQAVADAAARAGIPWFVLRVVGDGADMALPRAVLGAIDADGGLKPLTLVGGLLGRPADIPDFIRLARAGSAGLAALRRVTPFLFGGHSL